jgi:hypothetical protein
MSKGENVMNPTRLEMSGEIDAAPEVVYGIISDYQNGHQQILPRPEFADMTVEAGGQGAGTIIRVTIRVMGTETVYRMNVTEPEPGRVIQEEDETAGVCTTFTIDPLDGGKRSRVTIATEWKRKPGFAGFMERLLTPAITRPLYKRELEQLNAQAQKGA